MIHCGAMLSALGS
jgi:IS5 family transposase